MGSALFPLEWKRLEGTGLRQEAAGPQSSACSRASHEAAPTTAGPGRGLARARDSRQVPLTHTPQDPRETSSLPGLLPSFYSISVSRAFSRAGSPFFPPQREAPLRPWTLGCSTSPPSGSTLPHGAQPRGPKNGMSAGRAPPAGREKAGESSSLLPPAPGGASYRPGAPCTGESGLWLSLALGQALSRSWEGG